MPDFYVYVMASKRDGVVYIGVTNDLKRRACEHRDGVLPGFTKTYQVKKLVHYEIFSDPENAILREKRLKKWKREWKIRLIETENPDWQDLYQRL